MQGKGMSRAAVVLALGVLPATAFAGVASATTQPQPTKLSIRASETAVRPHTKDTISGVLRSNGTRLAGQRVELEQRQAGTKKWTVEASGTTGAKGRVAFTVTPTHRREQYELVFSGTAAYAASHSAVVTVTVKNGTSLSISAAHDTVKPHEADTITGSLKSNGIGLRDMTVTLRDRKKGTSKWSEVRSATTGANGHVRFSVVPASSDEQYKLTFAGTSRYFASHSGVVTVRVA